MCGITSNAYMQEGQLFVPAVYCCETAFVSVYCSTVFIEPIIPCEAATV